MLLAELDLPAAVVHVNGSALPNASLTKMVCANFLKEISLDKMSACVSE